MTLKIKRQTKRKILTLSQFKRELKHEFNQAINDAGPDYLTTTLRHEDDLAKQDEIEKEINLSILAAKSRVVKKAGLYSLIPGVVILESLPRVTFIAWLNIVEIIL